MWSFPPVRFQQSPSAGLGGNPGRSEMFREVATRDGVRRSYWVLFDEPQYDPDGDGPYIAAEVLDKYLESVG